MRNKARNQLGLCDACRSHKDLIKEAAPHYKKARKFYDSLAAQLVQQGHALDVFACSLDQVHCLLACNCPM